MKRIVCKLSGAAFKGDEGGIFGYERMKDIGNQIKVLCDRGIEVVVICGAGNVWRQRENKHFSLPRVISDYVGMSGGVMNSIVFGSVLSDVGVDMVVYSPASLTIPHGTKVYDNLQAKDDLSAGKVVVLGGGSGNPFSTHDLAGVLRGLELDADCMIKCTNTDGVYTKDPAKYDDAEKIDELSLSDALDQGLEVMDFAAMGMAMQEGLKIGVVSIKNLQSISTLDWNGTRLHP